MVTLAVTVTVKPPPTVAVSAARGGALRRSSGYSGSRDRNAQDRPVALSQAVQLCADVLAGLDGGTHRICPLGMPDEDGAVGTPVLEDELAVLPALDVFEDDLLVLR